MRRKNRKDEPAPVYRRRLRILLAITALIFIFSASRYGQNPAPTPKIVTLAGAIDLAQKQASNFKAAQLAEKIAQEDVNQARAAFYPRVTVQPNFIYTSPSFARTNGVREPSFLGADAITVYQGLVNIAGEIDTSGRLKATLLRNRALVESARSGSEIARRELVQSVADAYFNLALSETKRRGAELNVETAQEFENNTKLNLEAGEVAPIDLVRARLQTEARRDELRQTETEEAVNADILKFLIGYDFTVQISTEDLLLQMPAAGEIERYTETAISTRPEFAQLDAERKAAELNLKLAKTDRRPQLVYSLSGGFVSDSLSPVRLRDTFGVQASVGVTIPIFDKAAKSREAQAHLKIKQAQDARELAERQFAQAFYVARTQAISARTRIRELGIAINDAEQNVRASTARYQAGEAPISEVTDAQNTLVLQRQLLYQAIFDYQTARSRLLRAIGQ